ncbi:MAG: hypothetical protein P8J20_18215 [Novosphingobium sp.]|nr:hypothetical protein [Novosphingobium sp.]
MKLNLLASAALGLSVLAFAGAPQIALAETGDSAFDHQTKIIRAQAELKRICDELDEHQKVYDDWQNQVADNRKVDAKINQDMATLRSNADQRRSEAYDTSTGSADLRARFERIDRIEALIKERLENDDLENARKSWALSANEYRVVGNLNWSKSEKAEAKAKLEQLKNSRPGQSDILTKQPGKNPGPNAPMGPDIALAEVLQFIRDYDFNQTPESPIYADWKQPVNALVEDQKWGEYLGETERQITCFDNYFLSETASDHPIKFGYETISHVEFDCVSIFNSWGLDGEKVVRDYWEEAGRNDAIVTDAYDGDAKADASVYRPAQRSPIRGKFDPSSLRRSDGSVDLDAVKRLLEQATGGIPNQPTGQGRTNSTSTDSVGTENTDGSSSARSDDDATSANPAAVPSDARVGPE